MLFKSEHADKSLEDLIKVHEFSKSESAFLPGFQEMVTLWSSGPTFECQKFKKIQVSAVGI